MVELIVIQQSGGLSPAEVARLNALPAGAQPEQSTTIHEGGRTVRITRDRSGNTTITRSGSDGVGDATAGVDPIPPVPPTPVIPITWNGGSDVIPRQAVDMAYAFFLMCAVMVIGWPIARAFGRRIERRGEVAMLPPGTAEQLQRIEQAVDAMAIEVERISESQRFLARLQKSSTAEPV